MRERRLLERIRTWKEQPQRRSREDPKNVIDSVLGHLERILNTRRGGVPIADDYGMPDFTDFRYTYPDSLREVERAIRQMLQKYEPRLKAVRINFVPQEDDLLSLRFQINARLAADGENIPVLFESLLDADGRFKLLS
jgi:type VI secretion system protein